MGTRSKVAVLPVAVRDQLDRLIVERAFSGYQALAEWLQGQGYRISDDSVQRYGARLQQQLDAIKLAGHQSRALAAAGKSARDTANDLIAINVQQILQQTLGILLQAPEPCASSGRTDATAETSAAASGNPGVSDVPTTESCEEPAPVLADGEPKKLDVRDLVKLTRITVDLSRTITDQIKSAEQLKEQARQARPSLPLARSFAGEGAGEGSALSQTCNRDSSWAATEQASKPKRKGLSEETYQTIRNALLAPNEFTPQPKAAPPAFETSAEPGGTPADPVTTIAEPTETPARAIESAPESSGPAQAQPNPLEAQSSPVEAQPNPAQPTEPQLTAPDRIYPHQTVYRVPIESVTNWVWPTLVFPKPAPFPRPQARAVSPAPQPQTDDKTPEPPTLSDPDRTRGSS